jgi:hypothetical protein
MFGRLRPNMDLRYHACGAGSGPIHLLVPQIVGMRDLPGLNGAWMEERHDVYECRAFVDWRRYTGPDTVRLHSHPVA